MKMQRLIPVILCSYLVSNSICADPDKTPVPDSTADPDARCPPFATTTLPDVDESKAKSTLFTVAVVIEDGIIS